ISAQAIKFRAVPGECKAALKETLGKKTDIVVDWSDLRAHIVALGYSQEIAEEKLEDLQMSSDAIEQVFQKVYPRRKRPWKFKGQISKQEMAKLLKTPPNRLQHDMVFSSLPLWAAIPGFKVDQFVKHIILSNVSIEEHSINSLIMFSPLWLSPKDNNELVSNLLERRRSGPSMEQMAVLVAQLKPKAANRTLRSRAARRFAKAFGSANDPERSLRFASAFPVERMTKGRQRELFAHIGIDLEKYPPITMKSVSTIHCAARDAGDCEDMTLGHLGTLFDKEWDEYGERTIISVRGKVVGSVKFTGDQSFLALRNVVDEQGRLVLAMGGVYQISNKVLVRIEEENSYDRNATEKIFNVNWLGVRPHTFLMNGETFSHQNLKLWLQLGMSHLSREELGELLLKSVDDEDIGEQLDEMRARFRDVYLAAIDDLRREIESTGEL
ncbi:MAG: hypothetical protein AAF202_10130, partial [Pseudomonadota bacterium]